MASENRATAMMISSSASELGRACRAEAGEAPRASAAEGASSQPEHETSASACVGCSSLAAFNLVSCGMLALNVEEEEEPEVGVTVASMLSSKTSKSFSRLCGRCVAAIESSSSFCFDWMHDCCDDGAECQRHRASFSSRASCCARDSTARTLAPDTHSEAGEGKQARPLRRAGDWFVR